MHLEELFRSIERNRREFIARRAAKVCSTGSADGVLPRAENRGGTSAGDEIEAVETEVGAAIRR